MNRQSRKVKILKNRKAGHWITHIEKSKTVVDCSTFRVFGFLDFSRLVAIFSRFDFSILRLFEIRFCGFNLSAFRRFALLRSRVWKVAHRTVRDPQDPDLPSRSGIFPGPENRDSVDCYIRIIYKLYIYIYISISLTLISSAGSYGIYNGYFCRWQTAGFKTPSRQIPQNQRRRATMGELYIHIWYRYTTYHPYIYIKISRYIYIYIYIYICIFTMYISE